MDLFEPPKERNIDDIVQSCANIALSAVPLFGPVLAAIVTESMPNTFRSRITSCIESFREYLLQIERERQLALTLNPYSGILLQKSSELAAFSILEEQPKNLGRATATLAIEDKLVYTNSIFLLKLISQLDEEDLLMLLFNGASFDQANKLRIGYPESLSEENQITPSYITRQRRLIGLGLLIETQSSVRRPSLDRYSIDLGEGLYEMNEIGKAMEMLPEWIPTYDEYGAPVMEIQTSDIGHEILKIINPKCMQFLENNK